MHRRLTHTRKQNRLVAVIAASVLLFALTACGAPPWETVGAGGSPTPSPRGTISTIKNDLASGSTRRLLTAGTIGVTVDYWSDLSMKSWTAGANKPLSFSLTGMLKPDDGQQVYLSKVSAVVAVMAGNRALPSPATLSDQASISPGYLIKSPYSYSQTFVLPALDSKATSVTVNVTYELLLQTTPTSVEYAKQTATDMLTIAIAH